MKNVRYEEEGVASAVGTIFAILIFVSLLSIFVTTYMPATMMANEEQYSSSIMNSMVQLASTINQMNINFQPGEEALIPFNLESSYVPIFSSPTFGYINISANSPGQEGYLTLAVYNGPVNPINKVSQDFSVGGALMAFTNNRYFTDEAWSYEISSLYYFNPYQKNQSNTNLISGLIHINPKVNGMNNITIDLINIIGGPNTISTSSPVTISLTAINKQTFSYIGSNISMNFDSFILSKSIINSINQSISLDPSISWGHGVLSLGSHTQIYINELTIIVGMSSFNP
mgnify:CR=1 FL=1